MLYHYLCFSELFLRLGYYYGQWLPLLFLLLLDICLAYYCQGFWSVTSFNHPMHTFFFADLRSTYKHDSLGLAKCYYFVVFIFPRDFLSSAVSVSILYFFFVHLLLFSLYPG